MLARDDIVNLLTRVSVMPIRRRGCFQRRILDYVRAHPWCSATDVASAFGNPCGHRTHRVVSRLARQGALLRRKRRKPTRGPSGVTWYYALHV